jgi:hypothetical protein
MTVKHAVIYMEIGCLALAVQIESLCVLELLDYYVTCARYIKTNIRLTLQHAVEIQLMAFEGSGFSKFQCFEVQRSSQLAFRHGKLHEAINHGGTG